MNKRLRAGEVIAAVFVLVIILLALWFRKYDCPLDIILGIPCPLCGMTRAFFSLPFGKVEESFYYHPLWPLVVITALLGFAKATGSIKPSKKAVDIYLIFLAASFLVCYIIRHIMGSPVVAVHFETSLVYRLFHFFF